MLDMLQKIEKDQEITTRIQATNNINACYYVLADGTMVTLGYEDGYRTDDHRAIFSYFKMLPPPWFLPERREFIFLTFIIEPLLVQKTTSKDFTPKMWSFCWHRLKTPLKPVNLNCR